MNRTEILRLAEQYVSVDRETVHGAPERTFGLIAEFWSVYLDRHVSDVDVAIMMMLLKIARLRGNPQSTDGWIDAAGYAACGGELATGLTPAAVVSVAL